MLCCLLRAFAYATQEASVTGPPLTLLGSEPSSRTLPKMPSSFGKGVAKTSKSDFFVKGKSRFWSSKRQNYLFIDFQVFCTWLWEYPFLKACLGVLQVYSQAHNCFHPFSFFPASRGIFKNPHSNGFKACEHGHYCNQQIFLA